MTWRCARGADCIHPWTDGAGGIVVPNNGNKADSLQGDPPPHGLCGWCWFEVKGPMPLHMSAEEART